MAVNFLAFSLSVGLDLLAAYWLTPAGGEGASPRMSISSCSLALAALAPPSTLALAACASGLRLPLAADANAMVSSPLACCDELGPSLVFRARLRCSGAAASLACAVSDDCDRDCDCECDRVSLVLILRDWDAGTCGPDACDNPPTLRLGAASLPLRKSSALTAIERMSAQLIVARTRLAVTA